MAHIVYQHIQTVPDKRTALALSRVADNLVPSITSKTLIAAYSVPASENGATYFLNLAGGFAVTLPLPAAGLRYNFIVTTAPTTAYTVATANSANIIKGLQNSVAGDAGDFGTADDTISFVASNALAGDRVEVFSDGTSWFAYARSKVAAGITFTQAT